MKPRFLFDQLLVMIATFPSALKDHSHCLKLEKKMGMKQAELLKAITLMFAHPNITISKEKDGMFISRKMKN